MSTKTSMIRNILVALLTLNFASCATSQEAASDAEPASTNEAVNAASPTVGAEANERGPCLDLSRVQTIDVIDKQTVLVTMHGNEQYKITTVNRCSGLSRNSPVIFDVRGPRQVCPVDSLKGSTTGSIESGIIVSCPIETIQRVETAKD